MFRIIPSSKTTLTLALSLGSCVLALHNRPLKADIITDIEEIDKEKEAKKPEKKKKAEPSKAEATKANGTSKAKSAPSLEAQEPELQNTIPEPAPTEASPASQGKAPALKSAKGKTKEQRQKAPVHWKSEGTTTYSQDRSTITLSKNVMITQDDLRLQSDEAKVTFMPKNSGESGVKLAVLDGKVDIARYSTDPSERMNAKSDRATFDNQQQVVTLDGNARLWRAGDLVRGERIIYDLTSGMIKIDKAQGVVQPDRTKK